MKALLRFGAALFVLALLIPAVQCNKDDGDDIPDDPTNTRDYLYDKWWYNDQGLGDYYFNSDGTYEYSVPYNTGQWQWFNDYADSMKLVQNSGGDWNIWFREITETTFKMSQSNEGHANIYNYKDTQN